MSEGQEVDPAELLLRYRVALRAGHMGVWEWDITSGSATWIDDAGVLPSRTGEPTGTFESFISRLHPEDAPAVLEAVQDAMATGRSFQLRFRTAAGDEIRWVQASAEVLRSQDGTPERMIGVAADVTEAESAKERLRSVNELLEHIVDSSDLFLFASRSDGAVLEPTYISRNVEQHLGYTPEELMRPGAWLDIVHPDDQQQLQRALSEHEPGKALEYESRYRHADGSQRWLRVVVRFSQGEGSHPVRLLGYATDVTERRRTEEHMRHAQRMEVVGELAGGIAHDFNNLLTAVIGYAEIAAAGVPADSPAAGAIAESRAAAERASDLVAQLLTFGRRQETRPEPVDVAATIADLRPLLDVTTGDGVRLEVHSVGPLPRVEIDEGQLEQVLLNLVVNARDALDGKGAVQVRTSAVHLEPEAAAQQAVPPGRYVSLSVIDDGKGIADSALPHVFEPFFTTKETGSGLGLAMVYGIVTQAGGTACMDSELGQGTTVEILLPAAHGALAAAAPPEDARSRPQGSSGTVLLVEDHPQVRTLAAAALSKAGHEVLVAGDGAEAMALAHQVKGVLDVLVTDVSMPGVDGPELADRLRDRRPGLRVLFVSGFPNAALGREEGMSFLSKPYTLSELTDGVAALLGARR